MIDEFKSAMHIGPKDEGVESVSWAGAGQKVDRRTAEIEDERAARQRQHAEYMEQRKVAVKAAQGDAATFGNGALFVGDYIVSHVDLRPRALNWFSIDGVGEFKTE